LRIAFILGLALTVAACAARAPQVLPSGLFPMNTLWTVALDDQVEGGLAADERRVFVATRDGRVQALDRDTGASLWSTEGPARRVLSGGAGSLVVRSLDGSVARVDPATGATRWSAPTGVKGDIPALVSDQVVVIGGEGLTALDAATGRSLWSGPAEPVVTAPPALVGGCLAVGEADGTLRCRDPRTGASRWAYKTGSALLAPPVGDASGRLFFGTTDRRVLSLKGDNGHRRWRWRVGADVQSSPALSGDKVLVAAFDAVLYAFHAGNGNLAWRSALPSRPLSAPLVREKAVIVACNENEILGYDLATGRRLGSLKTAEAMRTPPILVAGRLFVGLRNRSIQALALPTSPGVPDEDSGLKDLTSERH
jgi:outer membrane protein assembly factor BamB